MQRLTYRSTIAWEHNSHVGCSSYAVGMFDMVFGELFSHGELRLKAGDNFWSAESSCMDDRLSTRRFGLRLFIDCPQSGCQSAALHPTNPLGDIT